MPKIKHSNKSNYCFFEAKVAEPRNVKKLSEDRLIELTWLRNRNIDLVDFIVRPDGCLVGRTVHPIDGLDFEEFIFSSYILAVEADRLEYLLKVPDEF